MLLVTPEGFQKIELRNWPDRSDRRHVRPPDDDDSRSFPLPPATACDNVQQLHLADAPEC